MTHKPKVSILIPCYCHESYIIATLQSVLAQTMSDFEILIADDCSEDRSAELIGTVQDPRITAYYFSKNLGTVRTLNFLLARATGDYIATLGSDDLFHPEKLARQCAVLDKNPQIGAVFSWAEMIDENSEAYTLGDSIALDVFSEPNRTSAGWILRFYESGNHLCHSSALIRKTIYDALGSYDEAYRQLHDFEYWTRLICTTEIYVLPVQLVSYRRAKDSSAAVSGATMENNVRLLNETYRLFYEFFERMPQVLFETAFKDMLCTKAIQTEGDLLAEKYFVLQKFPLTGIQNHQLAFDFFMEHRRNADFMKTLETKFDFTLKNFYETTAELFTMYPDELQCSELSNAFQAAQGKIASLEQTCNGLSQAIVETRSSLSWRITAPLRKIMHLKKK